MIGWKIVTEERKSPVPPYLREPSRCKTRPYYGTILLYPKGKIVRATSFCNCGYPCCRGIHFYATRAIARNMLGEYKYTITEDELGKPKYTISKLSIIKVCSVGRYVKRGKKCRAEAVKVLT